MIIVVITSSALAENDKDEPKKNDPNFHKIVKIDGKPIDIGTYIKDANTKCSKGTCTFDSRIKYGEEDGIWMPIEEMKSLKKVFQINWIEDDPTLELEIIDYNYTNIQLCVKSSLTQLNVPLEIYTEDEEPNEEFIQEIEENYEVATDTIKLKKDKTKKNNHKLEYTPEEVEELSFKETKNTKYKKTYFLPNIIKRCENIQMDSTLGKTIKWGENSDELLINYSTSWYNNFFKDNYVRRTGYTSYYSRTYADSKWSTSGFKYIMFKFYLNKLPENLEIIDFTMYLQQVGWDTYYKNYKSVYECNEIYNSFSWNPDTVIFTDVDNELYEKTYAGDSYNSINANSTPFFSRTYNNGAGNTPNTESFNLSYLIKKNYGNSDEMSMFCHFSTGTQYSPYNRYRTKEYESIDYSPRFVLVYTTSASSSATTVLYTPTNNSIFTDYNITFKGNHSATVDNIANVSLYTNYTGTWVSYASNITPLPNNNSWFNYTLMTNDQTFVWNIETCNTGGTCAFAPYNYTIQITIPDVTPPSQIENLRNITTTKNLIELDWDSVGSDYYQSMIFRNNTWIMNTTDTNYTDQNVNCGQTWNYTINARDFIGNINYTNTSENTILVSTPACDTTAPNVYITSPINNTNQTTTSVTVTAYTTHFDHAFYSIAIDNGVYDYNITNGSSQVLTLSNTSHTIHVKMYDTDGNTNTTSVNILIDNLNPIATITVPTTSGAWYTHTAVNITHTETDNYLRTCYYTLNGGSNTITPCNTEITGLGWNEDGNTFVIYVNDTSGNIDSDTITVNIDTIPPMNPIGLRNTSRGEDFVTLIWNESTDYERLLLYRNSTLLLNTSNPTILTYNDTGLNHTSLYNYSIYEVDVNGNVNWTANTQNSKLISTVTHDSTAPIQPTNVGNRSRDLNKLQVNWTDSISTDTKGYMIMVNGTNVHNISQGVQVTLITNITGNPLNDSSKYNITIYPYDIQNNVNYTNTSDSWGYFYTVTPDGTPPLGVNTLTNISKGETWINLSWVNPGTSDFHHVMLLRNGTNVWNSTNKDTSGYNLTGLTKNQMYNITLWTVDESGNINKTPSATGNGTFPTVAGDTTSPSIIAYYPVNESTISHLLSEVTTSITTNENTNCSYAVNNPSGTYYQTSNPETTSHQARVTNLIPGSITNIYYNCSDNAVPANYNSTLIQHKFTVDTNTAPVIELLSPSNGAIITNTKDVDMSFRVTDDHNISSCQVYFNDTANGNTSDWEAILTRTSPENYTTYSVIQRDRWNRAYKWGVNCTDDYGLETISSNRTFSLNVPYTTSHAFTFRSNTSQELMKLDNNGDLELINGNLYIGNNLYVSGTSVLSNFQGNDLLLVGTSDREFAVGSTYTDISVNNTGCAKIYVGGEIATSLEDFSYYISIDTTNGVSIGQATFNYSDGNTSEWDGIGVLTSKTWTELNNGMQVRWEECTTGNDYESGDTFEFIAHGDQTKAFRIDTNSTFFPHITSEANWTIAGGNLSVDESVVTDQLCLDYDGNPDCIDEWEDLRNDWKTGNFTITYDRTDITRVKVEENNIFAGVCTGARPPENARYPNVGSCNIDTITVAALEYSDDSRHITQVSSGEMGWLRIETDVTESYGRTVDDIALLNWSWEGYNGGADGDIIGYLWDVVAQAWVQIFTHDSGSDAIHWYNSSNTTRWVNATNKTVMLVHHDTGAFEDLYTDYVSVKVTYNFQTFVDTNETNRTDALYNNITLFLANDTTRVEALESNATKFLANETTRVDGLYSNITKFLNNTVGSGNSSFNQTLTDTLYEPDIGANSCGSNSGYTGYDGDGGFTCNDLWVNENGDTMTGNLTMDNNNISGINRLIIGDNSPPYTIIEDTTIQSTSAMYWESTGQFRFQVTPADTDIVYLFSGTSNTGEYHWMEDENYFLFYDSTLINLGKSIFFEDEQVNITTQTNGHLEINSDQYINMTSPVIDIDGNVTVNNITADYYYGNGSQLTNVPGDNLGDHNATQNLSMDGNNITNVGVITFQDRNIVLGRNASANISDLNNSVAIGVRANASGQSATAIGYLARAYYQSTAIGTGAYARNNSAFALGVGSMAYGQRSWAAGILAGATGFDSMAMGYWTRSYRSESIAIGASSMANGTSCVALAGDASCEGTRSISIGKESNTSADYSIAIGSNAQATANNSIAIGSNVNCDTENDVCIGGASSMNMVSGNYNTTGNITTEFVNGVKINMTNVSNEVIMWIYT